MASKERLSKGPASREASPDGERVKLKHGIKHMEIQNSISSHESRGRWREVVAGSGAAATPAGGARLKSVRSPARSKGSDERDVGPFRCDPQHTNTDRLEVEGAGLGCSSEVAEIAPRAAYLSYSDAQLDDPGLLLDKANEDSTGLEAAKADGTQLTTGSI